MVQLCMSCKTELEPVQGDLPQHSITRGICRSCVLKLDAFEEHWRSRRD